jgi:high affinity Mn2+ porin
MKMKVGETFTGLGGENHDVRSEEQVVRISPRMFFFQVNFADSVGHALQPVRQFRPGGVAFRSLAKHVRWAFFVGLLLRPALASAQSSAAQTAESDNATDQTTIFPNCDTSRWLIPAQASVVFQWHPAFPTEYGANTLTPQAQSATTHIFTLYSGFLGWGRTALAAAPDPTTDATSSVGLGAAAIPATQPTSSATEGANGPDQIWNFHVQDTDVVQGYPAFSAQYSGPQSLPTGGEARETVSLDLMAGVRLWSGAEAYIDGLMWQGFGLNNVLGIEGFPSGEAYRIGTAVPNGSIARLFIRQTINLGGEQEDTPNDQLSLAGKHDISRLTFTLGRFAAVDIFDTNAYAGDPRTQFMNWGLVNNLAWDYPADVIGFDTGLAVELNQPKWTLRYGFFQVPSMQNSFTEDDQILTWPHNSSAHDAPFFRGWAMVTEFERRYSINTHPGAIRFLAYSNRADMFSYSGAIPILRANGVGADVSAASAYRFKYGFGLNWEQEIAKNVGLFSRLGWNDGQEEAWMFTDVDYTASLGLSFKGEAWHRPGDTFGLAGLTNGITSVEQEFLKVGGLGILAGDGNLDYGWEKILETYYDAAIWKTVHATADYQFIDDPAFNRDRGPVSVFGVRLHWQF